MAIPQPLMRGDYDDYHYPPPSPHHLDPRHQMPRQPQMLPYAQGTQSPQRAQFPRSAAPLSPRWDSIPTSSPYPSTPSPSTSRFPPLEARYAQSADGRTDPPSRPLTAKSSMGDMHGTPVENFSRPRKQSLRLPIHENPGRMMEHMPESPRHRIDHPSIPMVPSPRSDSFTAPYPPTIDHYPEPRSPRTRGPAPMPHPYIPNDNLTSPPMPAGSAAPWMAGDELRSSFRSQLTTSTGFQNTERSSVLTKDSSVTSLSANADEPSIEDVMGMYEKGFDDEASQHYDESLDVLESESEPRSQAQGRPQLQRQTPEPEHYHQPLQSVEEDEPLPPAPPMCTLDAEIRKSKMFFFSPAFASSVAHLAAANETDGPEKRDSGKSLQSEQSDHRYSASTIPNPFATPISPDSESKQLFGSTASDPTVAVAKPTQTSQASPGPAAPTVAPIADSSKTSAPSNMPQVEPEAPGSRDRYGFKKQNQYITREQYDKWDSEYSEYLARRKKKWVAFLKENSLMTDRPNRFPDNSKNNAKTKRFIRKGIPPEWRGAAWFYYAGGPAILRAHGGLYEKLLRKTPKQVDQEAIERDLHRTFPDNVKFKPRDGHDGDTSSDTDSESYSSGAGTPSLSPGQVEGEPPIISALRRVLRAFSVYNPRIGYCQSLNFLAGLLLLFVETEEQVFWLLNVITHIYLPGTHEVSLEGSKVDLSVLMAEIRDTMPGVWDKIGGDLEAPPTRPPTSKAIRRPNRIRRKDTTALSTERLPPITLCMTAWFMSCFIGTLPIETTLRVWDIFFYEGSKTLFRVALSIFKVGETEIKAVADPMEMFGVVQALPRRMLDANSLMETCFKKRNGFGHLSQHTIDEKRQERRETAAKERAEAARKSKEPASGNVTEAETEVRRKNTLFGRKKRDMSRTRTAD